MDHKNLTINHIPYIWSYADSTARLAATGFVVADVGKFARQLSDNSIWMLVDDSPITWAAVGASGGLVLLGEFVASADASLDIVDTITPTYDTYIFEVIDMVPATDDAALNLRVSIDNGANWIATGYRRGLYLLFASSFSTTDVTESGTEMHLSSGVGNSTGEGVSCTIKLLNVNSALYKHVSVQSSGIAGSGVAWTLMGEQIAFTADEITAVQFFMSSGNITSGTVRVYGVAK